MERDRAGRGSPSTRPRWRADPGDRPFFVLLGIGLATFGAGLGALGQAGWRGVVAWPLLVVGCVLVPLSVVVNGRRR